MLNKVEGHEKMLSEIKENVILLNEIYASHFISIQRLETQLGHLMSHLFLTNQN